MSDMTFEQESRLSASRQAGEAGAAVSVVIPFGGSRREFIGLQEAWQVVRLLPGDEVLVVDNSVHGLDGESTSPAIRVVRAAEERSSYHARNEGALRAQNEWLLFVDADCTPSPGLVDAFRRTAPFASTGLVSGEVHGGPQTGLLARYARFRRQLEQGPTLQLGAKAYAATANVMVRREAWLDVGGFCEGIRSGGDQDFSWRLRASGWHLAYQPEAVCEHEHREQLLPFLRQWARYGCGKAWLSRRFAGAYTFPNPVFRIAKSLGAFAIRALRPSTRADAPFHLVDIAMAAADAWGYLSSNRPREPEPNQGTVVVAARHPVAISGGMSLDEEGTGEIFAVEAGRRTSTPLPWLSRGQRVNFREDDGHAHCAKAYFYVLFHGLRNLRHAQQTTAAWRELAQLRRLAQADRLVLCDSGSATGRTIGLEAAMRELRQATNPLALPPMGRDS